MEKILIKNGKVWDGEQFCFSYVLTDNKKINKIEEEIEEPADFPLV